MKVNSIEWHKQCYSNRMASHHEKLADLRRITAAVERSERELSFYADQIEEAQKRGMESFDPTRLLVKRKE